MVIDNYILEMGKKDHYLDKHKRIHESAKEIQHSWGVHHDLFYQKTIDKFCREKGKARYDFKKMDANPKLKKEMADYTADLYLKNAEKWLKVKAKDKFEADLVRYALQGITKQRLYGIFKKGSKIRDFENNYKPDVEQFNAQARQEVNNAADHTLDAVADDQLFDDVIKYTGLHKHEFYDISKKKLTRKHAHKILHHHHENTLEKILKNAPYVKEKRKKESLAEFARKISKAKK